jgi:hypothetical protein
MGRYVVIIALLFLGFTHPSECPNVSVFSVASSGQFYLASPSNVIFKCDPSGKVLVRQNDKSDGKIHSIDANNPFEIYVYYEDQGVLVYMDNQLAERGRATLLNYFTNPPVAVGRSYNNGIWIYNLDNQQLEQYNKQWKRLVESPNIPVMTGLDFFPTQVMDNGQWVYLIDPNHGVLVFDLFGNYKGIWRFKQVVDLWVDQSKAWLLTDEYLLKYQPKSFRTDTIMRFKSGDYTQIEGYQNAIHLLDKTGKIQTFSPTE